MNAYAYITVAAAFLIGIPEAVLLRTGPDENAVNAAYLPLPSQDARRPIDWYHDVEAFSSMGKAELAVCRIGRRFQAEAPATSDPLSGFHVHAGNCLFFRRAVSCPTAAAQQNAD